MGVTEDFLVAQHQQHFHDLLRTGSDRVDHWVNLEGTEMYLF